MSFSLPLVVGIVVVVVLVVVVVVVATIDDPSTNEIYSNSISVPKNVTFSSSTSNQDCRPL